MRSLIFLKRAILVVLIFAMVFCVSCGQNGNNGGNTGGGNTPGFQGSGSFDDVIDMEGYTFTLTSPFIVNDPDWDTLTFAEQTLETVRHQVEEDYHCNIEVIFYYAAPDTFKAKVQSGDKVGDIVHIYAKQLIPAIRMGLVENLDTISGHDITDERWVSHCVNIGEYAGGHYALNFMRPTEVRNCLVYNRDLCKKFGVTEDLTQLARDKQWTWDKFLEVLKKCTRDTNGDGKIDVYGFQTAVSDFFGASIIASNNARVLSVDSEGYVKETLNSPETMAALNYWYDLVNTHNVMTTRSLAQTIDYAESFVKGETVFLHCESWLIDQNIRKIAGDLDYGLLPIPMGPNATDYASSADNMMLFSITTSNKSVNKTVPILNALARYVYKFGEEGWWEEDTMLDYFQEGDTDSLEMYYFLLDKSCLDYGFMIPSIETDFRSKIIENTIKRQKGTVAAIVNALHGTYNQDISDIFNIKE